MPQLPVSLLSGSTADAAEFLAKTAFASRRMGGLTKRAFPDLSALQSGAQQALQNPVVRNALIGGTIGGLGGGALGLFSRRKRHPLTSALTGALAGAGLGAGGTLAAQAWPEIGKGFTAAEKNIAAAQPSAGQQLQEGVMSVGSEAANAGKAVAEATGMTNVAPEGQPYQPRVALPAVGGVAGFMGTRALLNSGPIGRLREAAGLQRELTLSEPGKALPNVNERLENLYPPLKANTTAAGTLQKSLANDTTMGVGRTLKQLQRGKSPAVLRNPGLIGRGSRTSRIGSGLLQLLGGLGGAYAADKSPGWLSSNLPNQVIDTFPAQTPQVPGF